MLDINPPMRWDELDVNQALLVSKKAFNAVEFKWVHSGAAVLKRVVVWIVLEANQTDLSFSIFIVWIVSEANKLLYLLVSPSHLMQFLAWEHFCNKANRWDKEWLTSIIKVYNTCLQTRNLSKNLHDPIFGRRNFTHWKRVNGAYFRQQ